MKAASNKGSVRNNMASWRWILYSFSLVLAMSAPAYAGGMPPSTTAKPSAAEIAQANTIKDQLVVIDKNFNVGLSINQILTHLKGVSVQMAHRYHGTALTQIKIMMTILISLLGLRIAFDTMGGLSGTFRAIGELFIIWGLVMWTLTDYSQMTGWITNGFTEASNILLGANPAKATGMSFFNAKIYLVVTGLLNQISNLPWAKGSILSSTFLPSILNSLVAMVIYVAMAFLAFIAGAIYMIFYVLSEVYILVAIAVGPVFLPWALIPWTRKYAVNWIHFLIQGGMYRLIGPVMLGMVSGIMNQTSAAGNIISASGATINYIAIIFYALFAMLEIYLMLQIPVIVQSLSSGFFSSSLASGPVSSVTSKIGKK